MGAVATVTWKLFEISFSLSVRARVSKKKAKKKIDIIIYG